MYVRRERCHRRLRPQGTQKNHVREQPWKCRRLQSVPRPGGTKRVTRWGRGSRRQQSTACSQPAEPSEPAARRLVRMKARCIKRNERGKEASYKKKRRNHKLKQRQKALLKIFFSVPSNSGKSIKRYSVSSSNDTEKSLFCK